MQIATGDMTIEEQIRHSEARKRRTALLFGALAGFVFAGVAWGYDSFRLAEAHAMLPWLTFVLGAVPCMALGALVAYLASRLNSFLAGFLLWVLTGLAYAYLACHVPFEIQTAALRLLAPDIAARVSYPWASAVNAHAIIVFIIVSLVVALAGMLSTFLIDSAAASYNFFSSLFVALIWCVLFVIGGYATEDNFSVYTRQSVVAANNLVQFALDHEGQTVDPASARSINLHAIDPISDLIHRPRRLILSGYDDFFDAFDILIDFQGQFAHCSVIDQKVNFCEKVK